MTTQSPVANAPDLSADSYVVIGLATCYLRDDDTIKEITVIEPVPSAYLEAVIKGVPTSYQSLHGTTLGMLLSEGGEKTVAANLPDAAAADAHLCSNFSERLFAAARTYQSRTSAQLVPLGGSRTDINYSTEKKRILNMENVVSPEDNVKQHDYTHKVL